MSELRWISLTRERTKARQAYFRRMYVENGKKRRYQRYCVSPPHVYSTSQAHRDEVRWHMEEEYERE